MRSRLVAWIYERFPVREITYWSLHEEIPGGSSFFYTLGSSLLFVFLLQLVTGAWQLFYYVPTVDHAYESVGYLRLQVPFGWLMHGLHYWGNHAFIVLVALHILRVFIWGAYKRPRELVWLMGGALVLLTAGITFTGAVLQWDELGFWAGLVGTNILGTVPLIGDFLLRVMRGGETMSQLALSRFFAWHVVVFGSLLGVFIIFHLIAFRQFGSVGPADPEKAKRIGWFWPDQILKDLIVIALLFLLLLGLTAFVPAPFAGSADPGDTTYSPKPEWNFFFLYQVLKAFPGRAEAVGTVLLPLLLVFFLFALPFIDRNPDRRPRRRPFAMAAAAVVATTILTLTLVAYYTAPNEFTLPAGQRPFAGQGAQVGKAAGPAAGVITPSARAGQGLFKAQGCDACHKVNGKGGNAGPDLSSEGAKGRTRDWLATQIRDPKAHHPNTIMPPSPSLSQTQLSELVDYMASLQAAPGATGAAAAPAAPGLETSVAAHLPRAGQQGPPGEAVEMIGNAAHGAVLYQQSCLSCHGPDGKGGVPNPGSTVGIVPGFAPIRRALLDKNPAAFAVNVDRYIQHGSMPAGPRPALVMPRFGERNTLSQAQIANIEAYLLSLNGVDRAQLRVPGVRPAVFFVISAGVILLVWLALGLWSRRVPRQEGDED